MSGEHRPHLQCRAPRAASGSPCYASATRVPCALARRRTPSWSRVTRCSAPDGCQNAVGHGATRWHSSRRPPSRSRRPSLSPAAGAAGVVERSADAEVAGLLGDHAPLGFGAMTHASNSTSLTSIQPLRISGLNTETNARYTHEITIARSFQSPCEMASTEPNIVLATFRSRRLASGLRGSEGASGVGR